MSGVVVHAAFQIGDSFGHHESKREHHDNDMQENHLARLNDGCVLELSFSSRWVGVQMREVASDLREAWSIFHSSLTTGEISEGKIIPICDPLLRNARRVHAASGECHPMSHDHIHPSIYS